MSVVQQGMGWRTTMDARSQPKIVIMTESHIVAHNITKGHGGTGHVLAHTSMVNILIAVMAFTQKVFSGFHGKVKLIH